MTIDTNEWRSWMAVGVLADRQNYHELLDEIDRLNTRVSELEAEATDPEHVVGRYIDLGLDLAESFRVDL